MPVLNSGPEPFFEDVVNHMAAICATPTAFVALTDSDRVWLNRNHCERGHEIPLPTASVIAQFGHDYASVSDCQTQPEVFPEQAPPRAYVVVPLILDGAFAGVLGIADHSPRAWRPFDQAYMARAARLVAGHFEARAALVERDHAQAELSRALAALQFERDRLEANVVERTLALQNALRSAQQANEAKTSFLTTISHELRTPLNAIIGYAEILEEDLTDPSFTPRAEDAVHIQGAAQHLLSLINEVLDFAKIEAGRIVASFERVDVAALIDEAAAILAPAARAHNNHLWINVDADAKIARTDPLRLRQCLLNLMSNAVKFTTDGDIWISAHSEREDKRTMLRIEVRDTGRGIPEAQADKLFEPFSQLDPAGLSAGGAGLGLATARRLSQLLGGDVTFDSTEGAGATFILRVVDQAALTNEIAAA